MVEHYPYVNHFMEKSIYIYIAYILHAFPYIHFLSMKLSFQHQSIIETSRVDNS